ncbi:MAG TPA: M13 family metallopeptidase [Candidatus Sulfotelmatobacter sp.]|nr:M13 family metallopeptidase [Candidatus Sulfotelmatobacter sp.]
MNRASKLAPVVVGVVILLSFVIGLAKPSPAQGQHGIAAENIDRSVKPGDDFYDYANGAWLKRTEIPPDRPSVGMFSAVFDKASKQTQGLIEELAKGNAPSGTNDRKIADLYNSYMNEDVVEKRGVEPLRPHLEAVNAIKDKRALAHALGESLRADVDPLNNTNYHTSNLFGLWVSPGFEDPDHYNAYLLQGGIVLRDREYYLSDNEHMRDLRTKYQAHVANMLKLAGFTDEAARATRIVELEHSIAEKHISLAENEDIHKANNLWTRAEFSGKAPGLDWDEFFAGAGLSKQEKFIVWQPTAFAGESALVASVPLETWKDWMAFHLVEDLAGVLPKAFSDERFAFFGKALTGTTEQRPRWQRGVGLVNGLLGDAVGQIYAKRYFSPEAKAQMQQMVANEVAVFEKRIDALTWMAASTKAEAKAKLKALYVGVGYPEKWRDYSKYEVRPDDLFGNIWRASLFEYRFSVDRLGQAVDRHEWCMTPQTVNAVNLPLQNALNFPAAILQPPFFDPQAPAAANYGAIGSVMGHEISHTFDSEGSTFDSQGRLRNWWTPEDLKHFEDSTTRLAEQYDSYYPFPDLHLNGKQTLGENIADVAGIADAYDAYHASLDGKAAPVQDGFSGDQQFFIAFAQNWATKVRDAALRQQVTTDPHSPGQYRASTVRNIDAWYNAFEVKPGEKLYLAPDARVRIW